MSRDDQTTDFSSVENSRALHKQLQRALGVFERARSKIMVTELKNWSTIAPLLNAIRDSTDSLLCLAQFDKLRDCYVINRTVFETTLNALFILTDEEDQASRARRHATQKAIRDLDRELRLEKYGIRVGNNFDLDHENPKIQPLIEEYTSRAGREIRVWTPESIQSRIATVQDSFGDRVGAILSLALHLIYRHASEIAHGTVFGALFAIGRFEPFNAIGTSEELARFKRGMTCEQMAMAVHLLGTIISVVADHTDDKCLERDYRTICDEMRSMPWATRD